MALLKRYRDEIILGFLVLVAAALRLWGLGGQGFWRDEAQGLYIAAKGFPGGIIAALSHDGHPPLYYLIMHFWMLAFGRGEFAVQLFSALCGVAAIPLVYALGRRLYDRPTALLAALVATLLPMHIQLSRSARMYALVALVATAALYLAHQAVTRSGRWRHVGLALACLGVLYSHNWGVFLVAAINVWWVLMLLVYPAARERWRQWAVAQVAVGILYLPWLPVLQAQREALVVAATWGKVGSHIDNLLRMMNELTGLVLPRDYWLAWLFLGVLGLLVVRVSRREASVTLPLEPAPLLTACTLVLPLLLGTYLTPKSIGVIPSYVTIVAFPALCLALGRGVWAFRRWWAVAGVLLLMGVLWWPRLTGTLTAVTSNLREVAAYVESRAAPGDVLIIAPDYLATTFNFYYRGSQKQVAFPMAPGRTEEIIWAEYNARWQQADRQIEPTVAFVDSALGPGGRVWLIGPVQSYQGNPMFEQIRALKARLDARFSLEEEITHFRGPVETADVYVYRRE